MKTRALAAISELREIINTTPLPGDEKLLASLDEGEQAIREGQEVTYGTLGNLTLTILGQKFLRDMSERIRKDHEMEARERVLTLFYEKLATKHPDHPWVKK